MTSVNEVFILNRHTLMHTTQHSTAMGKCVYVCTSVDELLLGIISISSLNEQNSDDDTTTNNNGSSSNNKKVQPLPPFHQKHIQHINFILVVDEEKPE